MINIVDFALSVVAKFFVYLLLARFWMVTFRLSFRHPLGEFIRTCTGWLTKPFEGNSLNHRRFMIIPVVWAWLILFFLMLLRLGMLKGFVSNIDYVVGAFKFATIELLAMFLTMMIAMMIVQAILSWVNPYAPVMGFLLSFTAPFLAPFRRIIPTISGIDFSPMAAIFVCYILIMLLRTPTGLASWLMW